MLWLKAGHLIGMVSWFAALFYLPRLYVYHSLTNDEAGHQRFITMERKLYRGIMTPAAIFTLVMGAWMLYDYAWTAYGDSLWLQLKLFCIACLVAYHLYCGKLRIDFLKERNQHSDIWYRWFNEIPVLFLVIIILLAVLKP